MSIRIVVPLACAALLLAAGTPAAGAGAEKSWTDGFTFGQKGFRWSSPDETVKLRLGGRLHGDFYIYDDDVTPLDSDAQLRRARAYLSGALFQDFRFKIEGELSDQRRGFRNLWGAYRGLESTEFKVGQFVAPQLFEDLMSSNDLTFMERSLAAALAPRFRAGGSIGYWQRQWSVRIGGFGDALNGDSFDNSETDGPGVVTRVTGVPWRQNNQLLHLGLSLRWRDVDEDKNNYRLKTRPESGGARPLVDTGDISGVDEDLTLGLEVAGVWGPVSILGEYLHKWVDRRGAGNPGFDGGYVQLAWFPTGERRTYSSRRAVFANIVPKRTWGAIELALRYSALNLTDAGVVGGDEQNVGVGVNWYFLRNFRAMFNYVWVDARLGTTLEKDQPSIFQFRLQAVL